MTALIFFILSILFFIIACAMLVIGRILEKGGKHTDKVSSKLCQTKHLKDVDSPPIWICLLSRLGNRWSRLSSSKTIHFKHLSKTKYTYTVNGKEYYIRRSHIGTPNQAPIFLMVRYFKIFPRLAYFDDFLYNDKDYSLASLVVFFWSIGCFLLGLAASGIF